MKFIPLWLAQIIGDSHFQATVDRIVHVIEDRVWEKVAHVRDEMGLFEAKGYLRARAAVLVSQQVQHVCRDGNSPRDQQRLTQAVHAQLNQRLIGKLIVASRHRAVRQAA